MSFQVAKIISINTAANPTRKPISCTRSLSGLPRIASTAKYSRCPPSSIGTGKRLISPMLIERIAARLKRAAMPSSATWAETATAFGTVLHPEAQWQALVRTPPEEDWRTRIAPDGRQFDAPDEGSMEPALLAAIARQLVEHTSTPDAGYAAIWEGWGGLVGHLGQSPSRVFLEFDEDPAHQEMLQRSIHDPFENVFRKPTWQPGILSEQISNGARLELPGRDHVLFAAPPSAFADPAWILDAPWRDVEAEQRGFAPSAQHPNLLWPADRAWVLVSEIDFDSTVVAGPVEVIHAICTDDMIEALPLREGADLTWEADEVNR